MSMSKKGKVEMADHEKALADLETKVKASAARELKDVYSKLRKLEEEHSQGTEQMNKAFDDKSEIEDKYYSHREESAKTLVETRTKMQVRTPPTLARGCGVCTPHPLSPGLRQLKKMYTPPRRSRLTRGPVHPDAGRN